MAAKLSRNQLVDAFNDYLDDQAGLTCQGRGSATFMLRRAHLIFGLVKGSTGPGVYFKLTKGEVAALIRGLLWGEQGWHIIEKPELGKRVMVLEPCSDHTKCKPEVKP